MRHVLPLALVLLLVASSQTPARADIPLPKNLTYTQPTIEFPGIDEQKEYVFQLRFLTFVGGPSGVPYTYVEVNDSQAFTLKAARRIVDLQLLAMKREEFTKRAKEDPTLKWLTDKTEGVLSAKLDAPSTVVETARKSTPITKYTVTLKDGKLAVETKRPEPDKSVPPGPVWWLNIAIAAALTLGISGLGWCCRNMVVAKRARLTAA